MKYERLTPKDLVELINSVEKIKRKKGTRKWKRLN